MATDLDRKMLSLYLLSRSAGASRAGAKRELQVIARDAGHEGPEACPWSAFDYETTARLLDTMSQRLQPESVRALFATLRGLVRVARRARVLPPDAPCLDGLDVPYPEGRQDEGAGRALTDAEVGRLIADCRADPSPDLAIRDEFAIHFLWATGFRRGSFSVLDLADLDADALTVTVRGKGKRRHVMPLDAGTLAVFDRYLERRGDWPGPLFVCVTRGRLPHTFTRQRFGSNALRDMLTRRAVAAGVPRFTAHDLRRTFVTDMIRRAGLRTAQRLANHSDPKTTARYDKSGREAMEAAVKARRLKLDMEDTRKEKSRGG